MRVMVFTRFEWFIKFLIFPVFVGCAEPSPRDFIVWGKGLIRDAALPVRYIFIQPVDENGLNITGSLKGHFSVKFDDRHNSFMRINSKFIDTKDGLYILTYRIYQPYQDLTIEIIYDEQLVGKSPYKFRDWTYDEDCYCPAEMGQWLDALDCKRDHEEMDKQLNAITSVNATETYLEIKRTCKNPGSFSIVNYVIKDNKIYTRTFGQHVQFKTFMDATLLSLTRKVLLPNMEFYLNLGDYSMARKAFMNPVAMFSWGGQKDSYELVLPSYEIMSNCLNQLYASYLDTLAMHGHGPKWSDKIDKAIFRGRDSSLARMKLYFLSKENPELIDANITRMFFFKWQNVSTGDSIPFYDFYKYKYIINMDGTVAPFRTPYLMGSMSVMLKEESDNYEFFYKSMKPNYHYVPFKRDLSDLIQKIKWAKDNDEEAEQFGKRAKIFALENLLPEHLFCYHAVYFKKYQKRLVNNVEIHKDMEHVEQPSKVVCNCMRDEKREDL